MCGRISFFTINSGTFHGGSARTVLNAASSDGVWFVGRPLMTRAPFTGWPSSQ